MPMTVSLSSLSTFGDVSAEEDAVLEYFVTTDAVQKLEQNEVFIILGRKGAGKTALVRHFTESGHRSLSKPLNLRGYPWNLHSERVDRGASEIEAYVSSWRYLIAIEFASLVLSKSERPQYQEVINLTNFMNENYGGPHPKLSDILRPRRIKLSKFSFAPSVLGNALGGVDLERGRGDLQLGLELNALSEAILSSARAIAENESLGPLMLHFDELDQGLAEFDENRSRMIIGLILAARQIRREMRESTVQFSPIIYLRTDLWDDLEFSDKNKISQGLALKVEWTSQSLNELVNLRLSARLGRDVSWEDVSTDDLMRGSQTKWNHILARSFLRPRDIIAFLNAALHFAKIRDEDPCIFTNPDIVDARERYSSYLKLELDDEILPHWPNWEEALQACSAISTITFDRSEFDSEYSRRKTKGNTIDSEEALQTLYKFSVIGYERRSGYGGSSWAFQYTDPEVGYDNSANRFKVHLGLKEYAKLRETRQQ
ncbi:hypothetical protein DESUT3_02100 [Desulfuromonas versatilis]|uniref:ATPase n=1 Tax=Desulfuromonas versatilis TaxID=2802975 RepID=A0ABM8HLW2_9BACT|nr:hypothetical protein [Desulfuromonas versatilis]BCR03141.1 hypothetical protein DESUT3_02100 [Desulfuromonas versatilis]